jgi:general secretion pathway protein I
MPTSTMAAERAARGFTLIEVLAALVIVALGMLGVIEAVTQTARNGTYLREKSLAHWIAMNVLTERRLLGSPPDVGVSSDELEYAGRRWRYTVEVSQTQVESLRRVDVSVRPADAPEDSSHATVAGFYGSAIGAAVGGSLDWSGADTAAGPSADDGDGDGEGEGRPTPPAEPAPDPSEEDE